MGFVWVCAVGCGSKGHAAFIGPPADPGGGGGFSLGGGSDDEPVADGDSGSSDTSAGQTSTGSTGGISSSAGTAGAVATAHTRRLTQVVAHAPWRGGQSVLGMAVDADNAVLIADDDNVYQVSNGAVSVYLTAEEASAGSGVIHVGGFGDLDLAPDGALYVFFSDALVKSTASHQATFFTKATGQSLHFIDNERFGYVSYFDGFRLGTRTENHAVYSNDEIKRSGNCATEDLAIAPSGVFLYEIGCNGSPVLRGNIDGSGISTLYDTEYNSMDAPKASNYECLSRDPSGGFLMMTIAEDGTTHAPFTLFHVTEDAEGASGLSAIPTAPSFLTAKATTDLRFRYCSMVAAADGTIFMQTEDELWEITP